MNNGPGLFPSKWDILSPFDWSYTVKVALPSAVTEALPFAEKFTAIKCNFVNAFNLAQCDR